MKIVSIFAEKLFTFQYEGETDNEYDRLMELWTDITFLKAFAKENKIINVKSFINEILQDAEQIQDFLDNLSQNKEPYGFYFEPLQDSESKKLLAFQKGKIKKNRLRYYAIKLDNNCFVITGGAIKMSQKMQEHSDTNNELKKLEIARTYLKQNGVFDEDSFFELIIEQQ
jgi:hypothetical protein